MNYTVIRSFLSTFTLVLCSTLLAAPKVQIMSGETVIATLGALPGALQVQADQTHFDASTGRVRLKGNVVLTAKDARGRLATLRASDVVLSSPDAEFQITEMLRDPTIGWFDTLSNQGSQAGFVESVLGEKVQKHAGFSSYRLRYMGVAAGAQTSGSVIYNRAGKTLKIYGIFDYLGAGILEIKDITYHGVTPEILQKALSYRDEKGELRRDKHGSLQHPNFNDLKKYGVTAVDNSRHFQKGPNEKKLRKVRLEQLQ